MNLSSKLQIHHLFHSSCLIETPNNLLIFDYYKDKQYQGERSIENGVIPKDYLKDKDNVYVFVTHNHRDHFNPIIFKWQDCNQNIKYILSNDISTTPKNNYHYVDKYQQLNLNQLKIETYGTTDQGVSFFIQVDGFNIYHAGDLNWWHWKKFTQKERKREEVEFKEEIGKLTNKKIDVAFIPVDPRLEEYYYLAGEYFAEVIKPKLLVPIHFSNNYYITTKFKEKITNLPVEVAEINKRGEKIIFNQ